MLEETSQGFAFKSWSCLDCWSLKSLKCGQVVFKLDIHLEKLRGMGACAMRHFAISRNHHTSTVEFTVGSTHDGIVRFQGHTYMFTVDLLQAHSLQKDVQKAKMPVNLLIGCVHPWNLTWIPKNIIWHHMAICWKEFPFPSHHFCSPSQIFRVFHACMFFSAEV